MRLILSSLIMLSIISCNMSDSKGQQQEQITAVEFNEQMIEGKDIHLVDVRTIEEYNEGHLASALNFDINQNDFKTKLGELDRSKPLFLYCRSGGRSARAASMASEMGFEVIHDMKGGITDWMAAGLPVVK